MKKTATMATIAVALLAGMNSTAMANGRQMPPPEPQTYMPPPAPATAPAQAYRPAPMASYAEDGPYISGSVGIGIPGTWKEDWGGENDMKTGIVLDGAVGYNFGTTRAEVAVGYQQHDFNTSDADVSFLTIMANGYYDIDMESDVRPYLMVGAGMASVDMSWVNNPRSIFAWQAGAGLGFKVSDNTTFDLGYRYFRPTDLDSNFGDVKWEGHNILAGLRYQF